MSVPDQNAKRKIATYNLGELGVVITKSPVHGENGELAKAQNAVPNPEGGIAGIHKRIGFRALNTTAANGAILSFISAALTDPGVLPTVGGAFGRYLYTDDAGANWKYLSVYYSVATADIAPTKVGSSTLVFLQALDGSTTGQIAGDQSGGQNTWDATSLPAAGFDQGRVPYVIPKCISVGGKMYYWTNATGAVRSFDGATDAAAWDLAVDEVLDWCTDGVTNVYVLVDEGGTLRVYSIDLSDYSTAQFGADLDFTAQCIEYFGGDVYVGGKRSTSATQASAVLVKGTGSTWASELDEGDYAYYAGNKSYAWFGWNTGNFSPGDTVTTGGKTYTFQSVLTNVDGNVLIGPTLQVSLESLAAAINRAGGAGYTYAAATTVNMFVSAWMQATNMMGVKALEYGPAGDSIPVSTTATFGALWYGEGSIPTDHLILGQDPGTYLSTVSEFTDLFASATMLWAAKSGTGGMSSLRKLQTATWTTPRTMPQPFGYVPILADGNEALFLETGTDIAMHLSKGIKLDSAWFFMIGTGDVSASEITVIALLNGALQRIEMPV